MPEKLTFPNSWTSNVFRNKFSLPLFNWHSFTINRASPDFKDPAFKMKIKHLMKTFLTIFWLRSERWEWRWRVLVVGSDMSNCSKIWYQIPFIKAWTYNWDTLITSIIYVHDKMNLLCIWYYGAISFADNTAYLKPSILM